MSYHTNNPHFDLSTYLRELEVASSPISSSATTPSEHVKSNPTPAKSSCNDNETASSHHSPSGTTSPLSTELPGEDQLRFWPGDFLVRTSAPPEKEPESLANDPACGQKWRESLAKYDLATSSWKTAHCLWEEDLPPCSVTLPKWGMMRNGELWERSTPEHLTRETASGFWRSPAASEPGIKVELLETKNGEPVGSMCRHYDKHTGRMAQIGLTQQVTAQTIWPTPTTRDYKGARGKAAQQRKGNPMDTIPNIIHYGGMWPTPTAQEVTKIPATANYGQIGLNNHPVIRGNPIRPKSKKDRPGQSGGKLTPQKKQAQLNPTWVEWLMGWPIEWTALKPLEMDRFHKWPQSPGIS